MEEYLVEELNNVHELGIIIEVVKVVEDYALKNNVTGIDTLVLQIGEISSVIPKYVEECYPIAVEGTLLENTKLKIEIIPANAMCYDCGTVFNVVENEKNCPKCKSTLWRLLSGKEFIIKEIVAY